jgi:cytochrome c-type biogenesis protein CcmH/NrfG
MRVMAAACCIAGLLQGQPAAAQRDSIPPGYPQSLERERDALQTSLQRDGENAAVLTRLAEVYLDMADDLLTEEEKRFAAYEEGAKMARKALALKEASAEAHFLYAANLGSAARLKGMASGGLALKEINAHMARAIELDPHHAPSLQMMGGLLAQLPWFLGGDARSAEAYLTQAIAADGNYTNARLLLARLLISQDRHDEARRQLLAVIHAERPHYPYTWARTFKPEAERLLRALDARH